MHFHPRGDVHPFIYIRVGKDALRLKSLRQKQPKHKWLATLPGMGRPTVPHLPYTSWNTSSGQRHAMIKVTQREVGVNLDTQAQHINPH